MKRSKQLTAHKVFNFLLELKAMGYDLKDIKVNMRMDRDSDVEEACAIEEDLYDSVTNNILESIIFIADDREV